MRKKIWNLISVCVILICFLLTFAGCGKKENSKINQENDNKQQEQKQDQILTQGETSSAHRTLSDKYVDYDNCSFEYNGKVYTLGVTTPQEMINDGVPFENEALSKMEDMLKANDESDELWIKLGSMNRSSFYVSVSNNTNVDKRIADCPVTYMWVSVHEDYPYDTMKFSFPLTMTEDELVTNAGKPTIESSLSYTYTNNPSYPYVGCRYVFGFSSGKINILELQKK